VRKEDLVFYTSKTNYSPQLMLHGNIKDYNRTPFAIIYSLLSFIGMHPTLEPKSTDKQNASFGISNIVVAFTISFA
jgi:hypothetical protein